MKIELQLLGYAHSTARLFREWPAPPHAGDLVHVRELLEPESHGFTPSVAAMLPPDLRVHLVWWGPFEDLPGIDAIVKLIAPSPEARR